MTDILAAEWCKLRSARSTRYVLGVMALFTVLMAAIAWYFVGIWDHLSPEARAHSALGSLPDLMGWIAAFVMAVFGTLSIASEYSSGMIRTTFTVMPRRGAVLAAKAIVVGLLAFVVTEAALWLTELAMAIVIGGRSIAGQAPLGVGQVELIVAMGLSTAVFALIGLALGTIARSGLASIVALAMVWYIVPLVAAHLAPPWDQWLLSVVPGALAGQLVSNGNVDSVFGSALPPGVALLALLAYAIVPLIVAARLLELRDV